MMMKKDIFIDNNIAKNFANPMDKEYVKLVKWLWECNDTNSEDCAYLVVSKKLLREYLASSRDSVGLTSLSVLIDKITREGRRIDISNQRIKDFQNKYFTKKIEKNLKCNHQDRDHIPTVLLSERKYALTIDKNFRYDLDNFPGFSALTASKPQDIPYDK